VPLRLRPTDVGVGNFRFARNPPRIDAKCGDDFRRADYSLLKPVWSGLVSPFNERHEKMSQ